MIELRHPSKTASILCAPSIRVQFRKDKRSTYRAARRYPLEDATCSYCGKVMHTYSCVKWKYTLGLVSHLQILDIKVNISVSERHVCANRSSRMPPHTTVRIVCSKWGVLGRYIYVIYANYCTFSHRYSHPLLFSVHQPHNSLFI